MLSAYHSTALTAVLQELQGLYSSGYVQAFAESTSITLANGALGIPVVNGSERPDLMLKVERNSAASDGLWPVTSTGSDVGVTTIQGGDWTELAASTPVRWVSSKPGLVEMGAVSSSGVSGGTSLGTFGALRQVRSYRDLRDTNQAQSFWRARLGEFPAACIRWLNTTLADGSTGPSWGYAGGTRVARGNRLYCDTFEIALVTTRLDSNYQREREGEILRDSVLELLSDRQVWRGMELSRPSGIQVLEARQELTTPTSYIDVVRIALQYVLTRHGEAAAGQPWISTRYKLTAPTSGADATSVDMTEPQDPT